jgi:hypothetical protein
MSDDPLSVSNVSFIFDPGDGQVDRSQLQRRTNILELVIDKEQSRVARKIADIHTDHPGEAILGLLDEERSRLEQLDMSKPRFSEWQEDHRKFQFKLVRLLDKLITAKTTRVTKSSSQNTSQKIILFATDANINEFANLLLEVGREMPRTAQNVARSVKNIIDAYPDDIEPQRIKLAGVEQIFTRERAEVVKHALELTQRLLDSAESPEVVCAQVPGIANGLSHADPIVRNKSLSLHQDLVDQNVEFSTVSIEQMLAEIAKSDYDDDRYVQIIIQLSKYNPDALLEAGSLDAHLIYWIRVEIIIRRLDA